ncbi:hypothetical protein [Streptomyces sp. TLI_185]|uniref:hypothetical protein n=1 Tax=Streptomyces sp. TLI_185 TaxID=2485151 RepID=UPI000F50FFAD|nr:hypothetical protein [Streptomyces sp. TLI_185]RPF34982.1 hypothetical protein EDD92_4970 [Streptomyces sp. TLI_185]
MIPILLIVSVLCLSGYSIVYSMSPPDRATVAGTRAQDDAAFLAAECRRFDELVADLDLRSPGSDRVRHDLTDRHSVNTITSDALDALYAERDLLREQLDTAVRPNLDALLDAYAHRGAAIQQALRLADTVIDAPSVDSAGQRAVQDFAHKLRTALLSAAPKNGT